MAALRLGLGSIGFGLSGAPRTSSVSVHAQRSWWIAPARKSRRCTSSAVGESRKLRSTGASSGSGRSALLRRVDLGRVDLSLGSPGR